MLFSFDLCCSWVYTSKSADLAGSFLSEQLNCPHQSVSLNDIKDRLEKVKFRSLYHRALTNWICQSLELLTDPMFFSIHRSMQNTFRSYQLAAHSSNVSLDSRRVCWLFQHVLHSLCVHSYTISTLKAPYLPLKASMTSLAPRSPDLTAPSMYPSNSSLVSVPTKCTCPCLSCITLKPPSSNIRVG